MSEIRLNTDWCNPSPSTPSEKRYLNNDFIGINSIEMEDFKPSC